VAEEGRYGLALPTEVSGCHLPLDPQRMCHLYLSYNGDVESLI